MLGNNKSYKFMGTGTIRIKMHDDVERLLQQVRYIPGLKRNLVSLGIWDVKGYSYKPSGEVIRVTKGCLVVMKGVIEMACVCYKEALLLDLYHQLKIIQSKTLLYGIRDLHM